MSAMLMPGENPRVIIAAFTETVSGTRSEAPISLTVAGKHRLDLSIKLKCCWDRVSSYRAVDESWIHIIPAGDKVPIFRYEYQRRATSSYPAAHLHVHVHRDEFAYAMMVGDKGKAGQRWRKDKAPKLAEFHFPLGGHRFRPCIEDILNSVIVEFGTDHLDGWQAAVEEGREQWRHTQLRAAVRDCPDEALRALETLGYHDFKPPLAAQSAYRRSSLAVASRSRREWANCSYQLRAEIVDLETSTCSLAPCG